MAKRKYRKLEHKSGYLVQCKIKNKWESLDKHGEVSEDGIFCRSEKLADDLIKRFEHRDNIRKVDTSREEEELPMDTEGSPEISE